MIDALKELIPQSSLTIDSPTEYILLGCLMIMAFTGWKTISSLQREQLRRRELEKQVSLCSKCGDTQPQV